MEGEIVWKGILVNHPKGDEGLFGIKKDLVSLFDNIPQLDE